MTDENYAQPVVVYMKWKARYSSLYENDIVKVTYYSPVKYFVELIDYIRPDKPYRFGVGTDTMPFTNHDFEIIPEQEAKMMSLNK